MTYLVEELDENRDSWPEFDDVEAERALDFQREDHRLDDPRHNLAKQLNRRIA